MTDQAPGPDSHAADHDRLNGWKEIAAHFGKSVRSVQRWEHELGMPVHRLHTPGGEIVSARRSELDKWESSVDEFWKRDAEENGRQEEKSETEVAEGFQLAEASKVATKAARALRANAGSAGRRWWIGAAAVVALAAVVWGAWRLELLGKADRQPASAHFAGDTMTVFNAQGGRLWEHSFPSVLTTDVYTKHGPLSDMLPMAFEDLDHDGDKEVLLVTWGNPRFTRRLMCFNVDGSLRFDLQPSHAKTYGGKLELPPFLVSGFVLTTELDGTKSIWVVAMHNYEFPSVLSKLDPRGNMKREYWSNGHINVVQEGMYDGRRVMLVGAMDNEQVATSLAVLDYENPSGFAPAENPKYRCEDCPEGSPLAFFVFPATEMSREFSSRPMASEIRAQPDGRVTVTVLQTIQTLQAESGLFGADVWYTFDDRLQLIEAETGDTYRRLHSSPGLINRLKHRYGPTCEKQIFPVLSWSGKGFAKIHPTTATAQAPSRKSLAQAGTP